MCTLVLIEPFAWPIQNNNYKQPDRIYEPKIVSEMYRAEEKRNVGVNDLICTITRGKEKYDTDKMQKIDMDHIIKERNPAISF